MRWQRTAPLALVSLLVLAGCRTLCPSEPAPKPEPSQKTETIKLKLRLTKDASGKVIGAEIDDKFHDSGVVRPGDRIEWSCFDCPEETEFAVEDLHFAGDLDELVDMLSATEREEKIEQLSRDLESLESSPPGGGKEQYPEVRRLIAFVEKALAPDQPHPLFEDGWAPSGYKRAGEKILSPPVAANVGEEIWKFTWKVRLRDNPASERSWDPCIYGHERKPYGT